MHTGWRHAGTAIMQSGSLAAVFVVATAIGVLCGGGANAILERRLVGFGP